MPLRAMSVADAVTAAELTAASPGAAHWSAQAYADLLSRQGSAQVTGFGWVATADAPGGELLGFICARVVAGEAEILNLAVSGAARRGGIGGALVAAAVERAFALGAERAFLEVRQSNAAARGLYQKLGFSAQGIRRGYYSNPVEDALILALKKPPA